MFRKGEKVIYPKLGAGKIVDKYKEKLDDESKMYYKIQLFDSLVTVSLPIDEAENLGLRTPMSKSGLRNVLKRLNTYVTVAEDTLKNLDEISREKLKSGKAEDAVALVNLLKSLARKKEKENKNFSYSSSQRLETALNFIKSETLLVLGKNAVARYSLLPK